MTFDDDCVIKLILSYFEALNINFCAPFTANLLSPFYVTSYYLFLNSDNYYREEWKVQQRRGTEGGETGTIRFK
jgi:hypothetical protein